MPQRRVLEQRPDGGQAQVPRPGAVVPIVLEVVEEARDEWFVEVVPVQ
jgi:hypothetical protein